MWDQTPRSQCDLGPGPAISGSQLSPDDPRDQPQPTPRPRPGETAGDQRAGRVGLPDPRSCATVSVSCFRHQASGSFVTRQSVTTACPVPRVPCGFPPHWATVRLHSRSVALGPGGRADRQPEPLSPYLAPGGPRVGLTRGGQSEGAAAPVGAGNPAVASESHRGNGRRCKPGLLAKCPPGPSSMRASQVPSLGNPRSQGSRQEGGETGAGAETG